MYVGFGDGIGGDMVDCGVNEVVFWWISGVGVFLVKVVGVVVILVLVVLFVLWGV